jgi:hypothetical protein
MVKRKMSEAQREAAAKNLAKARASKKPATYKNVAPSVLALDDDHGLSVVNIKLYVRGLNSYLRDGMFPYDFYGENEEHTVYHQTMAPAYDDEGYQK